MAAGATPTTCVAGTDCFRLNSHRCGLVCDFESHVGVGPSVDFGAEILPFAQRTVSDVAEVKVDMRDRQCIFLAWPKVLNSQPKSADFEITRSSAKDDYGSAINFWLGAENFTSRTTGLNMRERKGANTAASIKLLSISDTEQSTLSACARYMQLTGKKGGMPLLPSRWKKDAWTVDTKNIHVLWILTTLTDRKSAKLQVLLDCLLRLRKLQNVLFVAPTATGSQLTRGDKYRHAVISDSVWTSLRYGLDLSAKRLDLVLVELNHDKDHVHLVVEYPPNVSISEMANALKGNSSFVARRDCKEELRKKLWGSAFWTPSFFAASCGGAPIETLKLYVQSQQTKAALKGGVSTQLF